MGIVVRCHLIYSVRSENNKIYSQIILDVIFDFSYVTKTVIKNINFLY